ncbi:hypothetical protein Hokovirus_3_40 [Hokovirus HKV1]|uniref:Uncharacterized protein n=1 Tax=Hokovirus HKV1 TaxID=1977638 RepID=A0A1V0SGC4_9VIRU|nr:hypothetical protein Hokovirus_3_40 [Hokovirus HKV1]
MTTTIPQNYQLLNPQYEQYEFEDKMDVEDPFQYELVYNYELKKSHDEELKMQQFNITLRQPPQFQTPVFTPQQPSVEEISLVIDFANLIGTNGEWEDFRYGDFSTFGNVLVRAIENLRLCSRNYNVDVRISTIYICVKCVKGKIPEVMFEYVRFCLSDNSLKNCCCRVIACNTWDKDDYMPLSTCQDYCSEEDDMLAVFTSCILVKEKNFIITNDKFRSMTKNIRKHSDKTIKYFVHDPLCEQTLRSNNKMELDFDSFSVGELRHKKYQLFDHINNRFSN